MINYYQTKCKCKHLTDIGTINLYKVTANYNCKTVYMNTGFFFTSQEAVAKAEEYLIKDLQDFTDVSVSLEIKDVLIEDMLTVYSEYLEHKRKGGDEFNTFPFKDLGLANSRTAMLEAAIYDISNEVYSRSHIDPPRSLVLAVRKTVSAVMRSPERD